MRYLVIESSVEIDGANYISYGIGCEIAGELSFAVEDLCLSKARVENLVDLCNKLNLDPIHIDDVVEDFLNS